MPWLFPHCSWRSASRLAFPLEHSETFCAPQTAPVCSPVPGYRHKAQAQPVLTASQKQSYQMFWFVQCTFGLYGTFFPQTGKISQLNGFNIHQKFVTWPFPHQYLSENSFPSYSANLTFACSWWGRASIKSTRWQSQAEGLYYWMQLIRNFSFSLWRYSPTSPQHSRLKRNLEFISKTTSNFLTARESICKWK